MLATAERARGGGGGGAPSEAQQQNQISRINLRLQPVLEREAGERKPPPAVTTSRV